MSISTPDPDYFVKLPLGTDQQAKEDAAIEVLRAAWPDWEPNDGDPEVVTIEALALIIQNAEDMAASMPMVALVALGTKLFGIPFQEGARASTTVTLTVDDPDLVGGFTIPSGSQLSIDGYAFNVQDDLTTAAGSDTVTGTVNATENSTAYNDLAGTSVIPVSLPGFVTDQVVNAPTTGGIDPQTMTEYASDFSEELQLTSRAVITLLDFERAAVSITGILRAHAEATGPRDVDVWLLSTELGAVSTDLQNELMAVYNSRRLTNVTIGLHDPTFNAISVTWSGTIYDGFDAAATVASANALLEAELSPQKYGAVPAGDPGNTTNQWYNHPTIKAQRIAAVLATVQGIYEIDSVQINGGAAWADYAMTGTVPLPTPGTMTGTVST